MSSALKQETALSPLQIEELFNDYRDSNDIDVRNQIVLAYMPLVYYLARKFVRKGVEYDDLVQVGNYALIKAVERYNNSKNVKFSTFATPTIIGEIKHYFRDKQWSVRIPRRIKQTSVKIHQAIPKLFQMLQRSPTPLDIAEYLHLTEEEVLEAMELGQAYQTASLDTVINNDEEDKEVTLLNILGQADPDMVRLEDNSALQYAMRVLSDTERQLVYYRYNQELSQREVGEKLGLTQMQVSRMQRTVLKKLKHQLELT